MAEGVKIGGGYVDINADMSNFDSAMDALPKKASSKMDAAMKAIQARMAQNRLDLKVAVKGGDAAVIKQLTDEQERLKAKMDAVTHAATSQAQALQNVARASAQATAAASRAALGGSAVPVGPRDPRAVEIADYSALTKKGRIDFEALGNAGLKAGQQIRAGGASGAMGLMMLSQTIDDAQYGSDCRAAA